MLRSFSSIKISYVMVSFHYGGGFVNACKHVSLNYNKLLLELQDYNIWRKKNF